MDSKDWDDRYRGSGLLWNAEPNRFLPDLVRSLPVGSALDVACGEGRNSLWLQQQGWTVTGVDFSSVAIDKANDWAGRLDIQPTFIVADLETWTPEGQFDLVVEFYLHIPAEARRDIHHRIEPVVAPGGTYIVLGHHLENLEDGTGGPQDPAVLFTERQVADDFINLRTVRADRLERSTPDGVAIDALYVGTATEGFRADLPG